MFLDILYSPTSDCVSVLQSKVFFNKFIDFEFTFLVVVFND